MSAWIINKKQSGYHTIKRNEGYLPMVADVYGTDEEAQLIAAAPETASQRDDLLAALESLLDATERNVLHVDEMNARVKAREAAREAIAKAKGGER